MRKISCSFEEKIDIFFNYAKTEDDGIRLIAKIQAGATAFNQKEIYEDFAKIYKKFIRRNKDIGEFFIKETKDIINQLCDDFERSLNKIVFYKETDYFNIATEPDLKID